MSARRAISSWSPTVGLRMMSVAPMSPNALAVSLTPSGPAARSPVMRSATEAGWDRRTQTLTFPPGHPLLGRPICAAPGCQVTCHERAGVCCECKRRLARHGLEAGDAALLPPPRGRRWLGPGDGSCSVTGCPRPWSSAEKPLCPAHLAQQQCLRADITVFTARPDAVPLPSNGTCAVAACWRQLPTAGDQYCGAHHQRLRTLRREGGSIDELAWRRTEPPIARSGQVNLAAITPLVVAELLFGLQQRTRQGVKTYDPVLRPICIDVRRQQVSTLTTMSCPPNAASSSAASSTR
jgi:hypothetical protein